MGKLENEIVVKKSRTTIPVKVRKKYKIEEGTRLQVVETAEGVLLKPKKTIWDMMGAYQEDPLPRLSEISYSTS